MILDSNYWENRYREQQTGWDIGYVSTPIKTYFDGVENKDLKILIPGAGNAYEAEYLYNSGFRNVFVVDWAESAINNLKKRLPDFPQDQLIHQDFFKVKGEFDTIVEQTFFCSLLPVMRPDYARKVHELLRQNGLLVGVLFKIELYKDHPPFGGNEEEYKNYFQPYFKFEIYEECYNSIKPRMGNELFIQLRKKSVDQEKKN